MVLLNITDRLDLLKRSIHYFNFMTIHIKVKFKLIWVKFSFFIGVFRVNDIDGLERSNNIQAKIAMASLEF